MHTYTWKELRSNVSLLEFVGLGAVWLRDRAPAEAVGEGLLRLGPPVAGALLDVVADYLVRAAGALLLADLENTTVSFPNIEAEN